MNRKCGQIAILIGRWPVNNNNNKTVNNDSQLSRFNETESLQHF